MAHRASLTAVWGAGLLTVGLSLLVLHAPLIYDDENVLLEMTQAPSLSVREAIPGRGLTIFSHYAIWRGWGVDVLACHLANLALHLLNGVLAYHLLRRFAPSLAWLVVAIFWVHPLAMGTVAYITARADLLVTMWILLAVWLALGPLTVWRGLAMGAAVLLAGMSKEIGLVAIPLVALTRVCWARRVVGTRPVVVSLVVVLMAVCVARGSTLWAWATLTDVPWTEGAWRQLGMIGHLLSLAVWPAGLSLDHDVLDVAAWVPWLTASGGVGLALLAWRMASPLGLWALGWVVITVAPRFVFRTHEFLTEPQLYLSWLGVCVWLALAVATLWGRHARPTERIA